MLVNPNVTNEEIQEACKKAQIHNVVQNLPNKYDTVVGEGGKLLSGGERQRLALARAFLKKSKLIILDESTSALDNENQAKIKEIINSLDCNVLVIAHRLSTITDFEQIYVMEKGKVIANGTHEELLNSCKYYKKLYQKESA